MQRLEAIEKMRLCSACGWATARTDMMFTIAKPKPAMAAARSCASGKRLGSGRPAATK